MQKSIWAEKLIPALEYCDLKRAAQILGCEVDDFLYWAEVFSIELCLQFDGMPAALNLPANTTVSPEEWIRNLYKSFVTSSPVLGITSTYLSDSMLSGFLPQYRIDFGEKNPSDSVKYIFEYRDHPALIKPLIYLNGLWAIYPYNNLYSSLRRNDSYTFTRTNIRFKIADEIPSFDMYTASPPTEEAYDENLMLKQPEKPLFTITKDDLLITRSQIEKIYSSIGTPMPNSVNGEVEVYDNKNTISEKIRVTAKQSDYIVGLLKAIGISEDEMHGSISALRAKIARKSKGINLPDVDDNTLSTWLRRGGIQR